MTEQEKMEEEYKIFMEYLNSGMLEQDHCIVLDKIADKTAKKNVKNATEQRNIND